MECHLLKSEKLFDTVWVFNGNRPNFPSGVFPNMDSAKQWIKRHGLSGVLTRYPVGVGVYDLMVEEGLFIPKNEKQKSADFIASFSSAHLEHYHFEDGIYPGDG